MANTYEFAANTKAATGYTHKVIVPATDLTLATANTAQTITLLSLDAGDVIDNIAVKLVTPFKDADDSALNTTTLSLGFGGNTVRFLSATEVNENGTEVLFAVGPNTPATVLASNSVTATFGSMTGKSLANVDVGEAHIYLRLNKLTEL
jgi:hypothetical protein